MAYAPVPDANLSSSNVHQHLNQVYRVKRFLEPLRENFVFYGVCQNDPIPAGNGAKTVKWTVKTNLAENTSTVPEGTVGTSIGLAPTKSPQATLAQYADYATTSDVQLKTEGENTWFMRATDDLSYRAAKTLDVVTRTAIDAEASAEITLLSTYLTSKMFSATKKILEGQNVRGFKGTGTFKAYIHPYVAFDFENDPSAGSFQDLHKYTDPKALGAGLTNEWRGHIGRVGGVDIFASTNVKKTTGSPNKWRGYVFGNECLGCSSLEGMAPTHVEDPNRQMFKIRTFKGSLNEANPTGQIGGGVSYNFMYVGGVPLSGPAYIGGIYKYRWFDAPSSIVA